MTVPTIRDFASRWPHEYPRRDDATIANNETMIGRLRDSGFGHRPLDKLSRAEARTWALANMGHARYARAMYNDAIDDGIIAGPNPFSALRLERRTKPEVEVPTIAELDAIIEAADESFASMIRFAAFTGLRLGESLALTMDDLNGWLDLGVGREPRVRPTRVNVNKQLDRRGREKPPKNDSYGNVLCPVQALPVVIVDLSERLWAWPRTTHHDLWTDAKKAAGIDRPMPWHSLRHFCATWLLDLGATAEDVAIQLRHSDGGELVRRVYGHPDPELAMERLARLAG